MNVISKTCLAVLLAAALPCAALASEVPVPAARFFARPSADGAVISPDGRLVALRELSPEGRYMVSVIDLAKGKASRLIRFNNADVNNVFWISDQRLVFTAINIEHGGDMGPPGVLAIDRDGSNMRNLSPIAARKRSFADGDSPVYAPRTSSVDGVHVAARRISGHGRYRL